MTLRFWLFLQDRQICKRILKGPSGSADRDYCAPLSECALLVVVVTIEDRPINEEEKPINTTRIVWISSGL
jgi:hypothetical protein